MNYLIDTNVISEFVRARPSAQVLAWFDSTPEEALHVSVLTLGEIRKGAESLADASRRERFRHWLERDVRTWFGPRVLPVDLRVADRWGRILAQAGRPLPTIDSLLAATALEHGLVLVTRNAADFDYPGLEVVNPWAD